MDLDTYQIWSTSLRHVTDWREFLSVFADIIDICKQRLLSAFYNEQAKQRSKQRQSFAMRIEHEINRVSVQEDWKDYRFTDLEVEVEAEGKRKAFGFIPFLAVIPKWSQTREIAI